MLNEYNKIENKIITYNDMFYKSGPVRAFDYVSDKYNDIHRQIYNKALKQLINTELVGENKLVETLEELNKNYTFIELKKDEYYLPSRVIVKKTTAPFNSKIYDLTEYWDDYEFKEEFKDLSEYWIDEDSVRDAELIYIDYINGKGKFRSKYTQKEFWVDFKFINNDTRISKDDFSLANTFTYKLNNKIYGK